MNRQVFRYRSANVVCVVLFLSTFAVAGFASGAAALSSANGHAGSADESSALIFFLFIGLFGVVPALCAWLYAANARIEIEDGQISSYDLLGRVNARGSLASCRLKAAPPNSSSSSDINITSDGGDIRVFKFICDYAGLLSIVAPTSVRAVEVSFQPIQESFNYRGAASQVLSGLLLVFILVWDVGLGSDLFAAKPTMPPFALASLILAVTTIFGGLGVYGLLQGLNEQILVIDGMIEWIDCFGKSRIRVPYGAVVDLQYVSYATRGSTGNGPYEKLTVVTPQGNFSSNRYLRGFPEFREGMLRLMAEVRAVRENVPLDTATQVDISEST